MEYAYLGNSGLVVSKLGVGTMTFATPDGLPFAGLSETDAKTVIDSLIDAGVTLFDTANVYCGGQSESILGKLLGDRRRDVIIVTKGGARTGNSPNDAGLSARHLHLNIDESLKRLGTDWIDVYLCHLPDTRTPLEETLLALDQIVRSGKVRYIGFSNWPAWLATKAIGIQKAENLARFITGQYQYNLIERDIEHEIVPACIDSGIGVMAYSPLASGILSGKYSDQDPSGGGGRLSKISLFTELDHELCRSVVQVVIDMAKDKNVAPTAVALAWLLRQPYMSSAIMGINKVEHVQSNLQVVDIQLSADEMGRLSSISSPKPLYPLSLLKGLGDGWADPRDRFVPPSIPSKEG